MWTKFWTKTLRWIDRLIDRWLRLCELILFEPKPPLDGQVHAVEVMVKACCPCGSTIIRELTLNSSVYCFRCGGEFALVDFDYYRRTEMPLPYVGVRFTIPPRHLPPRPKVRA